MHENIKSFMQGFRYDAHPMGMLLASVGALSTFYPDANKIKDAEIRYIQVIRLIAKMPDARRLLVPPPAWASPTSIRTTTSGIRATSCRCCTR